MLKTKIMIVAMVLSGTCIAQIPQKPESVPSPQAWNFIQFGKTPVTMFTGNPGINVVLDEVKTTDFALPLSLSYNLASVRPDIYPGTVGLGWSMPIGGTISRKVRGLPDEFYFQQSYNFQQQGAQTNTYFNGFRNSSINSLNAIDPSSILATTRPSLCQQPGGCATNGRRPIPQILPYLWDNVSYMQPNCNSTCTFYWLKLPNSVSTDRWDAWNNSGGGVVDHLPDEFSFNVMGLSGKFFLPKGNNTEVTDIICDRKVKIYVSSISENITTGFTPPTYAGPSGTSDNFFFNMSPWQKNQAYPKTIWHFRIVDDEGNSYTFGMTPGDIDDGGSVMVNNPQRQAIEYGINIYDLAQDYWKADAWYLTSFTKFAGPTINFDYVRAGFQTNMFLSSFEATVGGSGTTGNFNQFDRGGRLIYPTYLNKIWGPDFEINLSYSESSQLKYEDGVPNVYTTHPNVPDMSTNSQYLFAFTSLSNIKWMKLDRIDIKQSNSPIQSIDFQYNNDPAKRLMLGSVTKRMGTHTQASYVMTYNTSMSLPFYLSGQTDHWGYWNGTVPASNDPTLFYQQKQPSSSHLFPGTLTRLRYPTGGHTDFEYEPNEYYSEVNFDRTTAPGIVGNTSGGGLRIKKISDYDGFSSTPYNERSFIYKKGYNSTLSQQQVGNLNSSGVLNFKPKYYYTASNVPYYNFNGTTTTGAFSAYSSQPLYYTTDDYQIGYSEVTEKLNDGSYTIHKFSNHDNGYADDPYDAALNDVFNTPFVKYSSRAHERGKLIETSDYSSTGTIKKKNTYSYKPSDPSKPAFYENEASYFNTVNFSGSSFPLYDKWVLFGVRFKAYKYRSLPDVTEETVYASDGSYITTTQQSFYENLNVFSPTKILTVNSKGEELMTLNKYAHPDPASPNFMMQRVADVKPNTIIEQLKLRKNTATNEFEVLDGFFKEFGLYTGASFRFPWLNTTYRLRLSDAVPYSQFIHADPITRDFNSSTLSPKDSRYQPYLSIQKYGSRYNPVDIYDNNESRLVYQYGNASNDVLAVASTNATISLSSRVMAFTSFEQYNYKGYMGNSLTEYDAINDFTYVGTRIDGTSYSGVSSFTGTVRTKNTANYGHVYVMANKAGATPTITVYLGGTFAQPGPGFAKIGERENWNIFAATVTTGSGCTIEVNSNGNQIDELRILPIEFSTPTAAQIITYAYKDGLLHTRVNADFSAEYFEYDEFRRLHLIRDQNKNILKRICYNYIGEEDNCSPGTTPVWQAEGSTRCQPCSLNSNFVSGIKERLERDINSGSATYNTYRWVSEGSDPSCVTAAWQNTATAIRCKSGSATGEQEQEQVDQNPCSSTYQQTRWLVVGTNPSCISGCNTTNCSGPDKKCINGMCSFGVKKYVRSTRLNTRPATYQVVYVYRFADCSESEEFTEVVSSQVTLEPLCL